MRVAKLGRRAVTYEIGLFKEGRDAPAATGYFVHVFVDRDTMRPVDEMPAQPASSSIETMVNSRFIASP